MDPAQRPIANAEDRFRSLVENIPGIVVYLDLVQPDDPGCSIPLYISPQIEELLGYPRAAWLTDDELWLQVIHPEDAERMTRADEEARRSRRSSPSTGWSRATGGSSG
jgi:PAS domain-containing protein